MPLPYQAKARANVFWKCFNSILGGHGATSDEYQQKIYLLRDSILLRSSSKLFNPRRRRKNLHRRNRRLPMRPKRPLARPLPQSNDQNGQRRQNPGRLLPLLRTTKRRQIRPANQNRRVQTRQPSRSRKKRRPKSKSNRHPRPQNQHNRPTHHRHDPNEIILALRVLDRMPCQGTTLVVPQTPPN